jgi:hypothetical protein
MHFVKKHTTHFEFSFAIPGTSAARKRVFSITNALWTDEKSCFLVETIQSVIVTKTHFEELSCNDSDFKQFQITSKNSFIYEVDISPRGRNNSFNNNCKLTSNKIL